MRRPSVLQVLQPPDGGVAEHVVWVATGLQRRGWHVSVATGPESLVAHRLADAGIEVHELALRREPHPGDVAAARALRRLDRRLRPDIVHAHSSKAGALVRAALPRPSRLLYTPHCFAFLTRESRPRRAVYQAIEQALVPRSGAIVAVCEWEAEAARRHLTGSARRLRTIHNCVPERRPAEPDARLRAFADGRPLAGLVSVMRPQKDPLTLVRAATRIDPRAGRIAIVGDGPLRGAVQREIDRLGVGDTVRLFHYGGAMGPHLAGLDVLVLSSAWEAFPLAVLEAMEAGLPVVATGVGGVPEAVTDGVEGRLVPAGDPDALAAALTSLLGDAELRARMGRASRATVRERFSLDAMLDALATLYEERRAA